MLNKFKSSPELRANGEYKVIIDQLNKIWRMVLDAYSFDDFTNIYRTTRVLSNQIQGRAANPQQRRELNDALLALKEISEAGQVLTDKHPDPISIDHAKGKINHVLGFIATTKTLDNKQKMMIDEKLNKLKRSINIDSGQYGGSGRLR